jgi:hypothetical protein
LKISVSSGEILAQNIKIPSGWINNEEKE